MRKDHLSVAQLDVLGEELAMVEYHLAALLKTGSKDSAFANIVQTLLSNLDALEDQTVVFRERIAEWDNACKEMDIMLPLLTNEQKGINM